MIYRGDDSIQVISGRIASNTTKSKTPRILTLGGDHATTLSALRSTYERWGPGIEDPVSSNRGQTSSLVPVPMAKPISIAVSVIHFDSHIGEAAPFEIQRLYYRIKLELTGGLQTHGILPCWVSKPRLLVRFPHRPLTEIKGATYLIMRESLSPLFRICLVSSSLFL